MEQVQSVMEEVLGGVSTAYGIPATTEERIGACPAGVGGNDLARSGWGRLWRILQPFPDR
jgi:hypothetical protein